MKRATSWLLTGATVLVVAVSWIAWLFDADIKTASAKAAYGSVLPALVLHTASNSWPFLVPILPSDTDQRPYLFVVGLVVTAAIWLVARRDDSPLKKGMPA